MFFKISRVSRMSRFQSILSRFFYQNMYDTFLPRRLRSNEVNDVSSRGTDLLIVRDCH